MKILIQPWIQTLFGRYVWNCLVFYEWNEIERNLKNINICYSLFINLVNTWFVLNFSSSSRYIRQILSFSIISLAKNIKISFIFYNIKIRSMWNYYETLFLIRIIFNLKMNSIILSIILKQFSLISGIPWG